jgi:hypothetical protein
LFFLFSFAVAALAYRSLSLSLTLQLRHTVPLAIRTGSDRRSQWHGNALTAATSHWFLLEDSTLSSAGRNGIAARRILRAINDRRKCVRF